MRSAGLLCVCLLAAPLRAGGFAGTWRGANSAAVVTIRDVEDGIAFRSSTGLGYTARFDEKAYPAEGAGAGATVTIHRLDSRTIRVVVNRKDGAVAKTSTLVLSGGQLTEATEIPTPAGGVARSVAVYRKE